MNARDLARHPSRQTGPADRIAAVSASSADDVRARWEHHLFAFLLIVAATLVGEVWLPFLGPRNLSLPFIAALMLAGGLYGLRPALTAAVAAFLAYNFFIVSPRFSLHIAPADLLALVTFLAAAVFVGGMAGRLSDRARSATERLGRLATLLSASRDLSAATTPSEVASCLADHLKSGGGVEAALWSADEPARLLAATDGARATAAGLRPPDVAPQHADAGCKWTELETARGPVGRAALWFGGRETGAAERHWIDAILQLGAIALDRAALATEISEARLVAEREGLRTALLSSLSHDLRTPISTILASASSLAENEARFDPALKRELVDAIQAEAERLNLYVSNLLDMTRLESGALDVRPTLVDPSEAMASALERMRRRLAGRRVARSFQSEGKMVLADPVLLEQALVNVLENAAAFSPPDSTITAAVAVEAEDIALAVADEGPGVPPSELARVFDKFFRGRTDRARRAGVGLGLSVARGVVEAFDGRISIDSPVRAGRGTRMTIRLPVHAPVEACE